MAEELNRREFLITGFAAAAAAGASEPAATVGTLPERILGRTGERVTLLGLGGASTRTPLSNGRREEAIAIIERALALGITYFDTAATYGTSEEYLGEVVARRRKGMFLATKSDERTRDGAWRELERSLKRLRTDYIDLWQMHRASLPERDTAPAFAKDGVIRAIEEAKAQKLIRFAGVTGHHRTDVLADWLERYPFDALLTVVNAVDIHHADSFIRKLLPVAQAKNVGVIAMKVPAYGQILSDLDIKSAMHYALSQPGVACCIIACDSVAMLEANVAAARNFAPLTAEQQARITARTAGNWQRASFYRGWT
ncbi:MAG: aldo/keto reductase [Aphanocapsa lilacina HA4352-LM1]|nr:aldo/keto reductase [Aphanocapsa lilacina HA4352-LM1]